MKKCFLAALVMMTLVVIPSLCFAQYFQPDPPYIPFQGQLRNNSGELVPDSSLYMIFRFYSDSIGGVPIWSESHPQVAVRNGLFNTNLGSVNPCSLSLFNGAPIYLETQIGDDAIPLGHRFRFGSAPTSGSSQRVAGDVYTSSGSIRMFAPQPEPPRDPLLWIETGIGGSASIRMFAPQPEPPRPNPANILNITSSPFDGGSFEMYAPQAEAGMLLVNANPQVRLRCDSTRSSLLVQRTRNVVGGIGDSTGVVINSDSLTSNLTLFSGNSVKLKLNAFTNGGGLNLSNLGSEYMGIEPSPFNGGGILGMRNLAGNNSFTLSSEGSASFFDDGNEYMGLGPSPFHSGGDLTMSDSNGVNSMVLSSQGSANFFSGGTQYMGVDPSPFNGTRGSLKMYSGTPIQTRVILSADGKLSLGTTNTSNILTIQQSSSTDPIADAWTTYSSRRWKTNIQPIQNALDKVMRLNGVTYDWIENGKHDVGLIAEEVGQVVPEIVAYEENGVHAKSVDYARLTALLIEGMKEQQKEIDKLKTEIDELKHKGASQ